MRGIRILWVAGIACLLAFGALIFFRIDNRAIMEYAAAITPAVFSLASAIGSWMAIRSFKTNDATKQAWILVFIGALSYFFAESIYGFLSLVLRVNMDETFPSIADYFWLFGYLPFLSGIIMLLISYAQLALNIGKSFVYSIIVIVSLILFFAMAYFLLLPIMMNPDIRIIEKFFYIWYPVNDLLLVVPSVILIYVSGLFGKGRMTWHWKLLAVGFIFFTIADIMNSYQAFISGDNSYNKGNPIELLWLAGHLLIALAGLYQKNLIDSFKAKA